MTATQARLAFIRYVDENGGQAKVAQLLGCTKGAVSLVYNKKRWAGIVMATKIEVVMKIPSAAWSRRPKTRRAA